MRIPAPIARKPLFTGLSVAAVALIAGLITWAVWPEPAPAPKPRERAYKATTACLLTDDRGIVGDPARAAWAGMQEASLATRIKVQYLAITGPQTEANGLSYYNSLGLRKCTVIIAAGPVPVATAMAGAARFPDIEHVTVGAAPAGPASSGQTASGPASSGADTGREPATAGPRIDSGQSTRAAEPTASSAKTTIVVVDAGSPALIQQRISEIVAGAADR